jgi:hypothetical protein
MQHRDIQHGRLAKASASAVNASLSGLVTRQRSTSAESRRAIRGLTSRAVPEAVNSAQSESGEEAGGRRKTPRQERR